MSDFFEFFIKTHPDYDYRPGDIWRDEDILKNKKFEEEKRLDYFRDENIKNVLHELNEEISDFYESKESKKNVLPFMIFENNIFGLKGEGVLSQMKSNLLSYKLMKTSTNGEDEYDEEEEDKDDDDDPKRWREDEEQTEQR